MANFLFNFKRFHAQNWASVHVRLDEDAFVSNKVCVCVKLCS